LAFKTIYYVKAARFISADTFLYPIRQAFQVHHLQKSGVYEQQFARSVLQALSSSMERDIQRIVTSDRAVGAPIRLPIFSAWLVMQAGSITKVIEAALELRNTERVRAVREHLGAIRARLDQDDLPAAKKSVQKMLEELAKASNGLVAAYGLKTASGVPSTLLMYVYNTIAAFTGWPSLPDYDVRLKLPQPLSDAMPRKGISSLYRDLGKDLASVWTLGEAKDRLSRGVQLFEDGHAAYNPKTEDPRLRYIASEWKSPM
jgi:hypothetical protein